MSVSRGIFLKKPTAAELAILREDFLPFFIYVLFNTHSFLNRANVALRGDVTYAEEKRLNASFLLRFFSLYLLRIDSKV